MSLSPIRFHGALDLEGFHLAQNLIRHSPQTRTLHHSILDLLNAELALHTEASLSIKSFKNGAGEEEFFKLVGAREQLQRLILTLTQLADGDGAQLAAPGDDLAEEHQRGLLAEEMAARDGIIGLPPLVDRPKDV